MHYYTEISKYIKDIELRQQPVIITVNEFTESSVIKFNEQMCYAHNSGQKVIPIDDLITNDIVNSTPGTPVVITPDTARGVNYKGALVYLSDLEGKITKFNLTNMSDDGQVNAIAMYDSTTLFTAG